MPNFCHNDELSSSLSWVDCLLTDSEVFILFAENSQILLKISVVPIYLTFMYLVALYQKNWAVNNIKSTQTWIQLIIVAEIRPKSFFRRITIWLIPIKEIPTTTAHMLISQNKLDTTHLQSLATLGMQRQQRFFQVVFYLLLLFVLMPENYHWVIFF